VNRQDGTKRGLGVIRHTLHNLAFKSDEGKRSHAEVVICAEPNSELAVKVELDQGKKADIERTSPSL
jgi:hypothetical protein